MEQIIVAPLPLEASHHILGFPNLSNADQGIFNINLEVRIVSFLLLVPFLPVKDQFSPPTVPQEHFLKIRVELVKLIVQTVLRDFFQTLETANLQNAIMDSTSRVLG